MEIQFRTCRMNVELPVATVAGVELKSAFIKDNGDSISHYYGLMVDIPEGHLGLLLPVDTINEVAEKTSYLGIICPGERQEIKITFNAPEDLLRDFYKVGDVTARLIIIPVLKFTTKLVYE